MTDYIAQLRDAAVAVLLAQNTLAADRVEAERMDPIETGDTPRIIVMADETAESMSQAGSAPRFRVTGHLTIDLIVEHARKTDAVSDLDVLIGQVKDALFSDPGWVRMTQNLAAFTTTRKYEPRDTLIVASARVVITCIWQEKYPPRLTTMLSGVDLRDGAMPTPAGQQQIYQIGADLDLPTT